MSLIPKPFLDAVVSIEVDVPDGQGGTRIQPIATGFLFGRKIEEQENTYRVFLVTNRHVFVDRQGALLPEVQLRFNMTDVTQGTKYYKVPLLNAGRPIWFQHANPDVDLAVLSINTAVLDADEVARFFFESDKHASLAKNFSTTHIGTGDGVFVLGFPLSMRGTDRNYVIVRQGIIARVDDELLKEHHYLIDAAAFPGNSGGPVINRPEVVALHGTQANGSASLIGVVSAGIQYQDIAVSRQTGEPRVIFSEQTGLVKIVPIELVIEVIDQNLATAVDATPEPSPAPPDAEPTPMPTPTV